MIQKIKSLWNSLDNEERETAATALGVVAALAFIIGLIF